MYQRNAFCFAVLTVLAANASTVVSLEGIVSKKTGQPVANAIVTLARQAMKDTTGADGRYSLTRNVAVEFPSLVPHTEEISIVSGVVRFTLSNSSPVKIEIFDINGTLLKKEVLKNAAAGAYRFDIAENCRATNLLVIKAAIGKREMSFPYVRLNSRKYPLNQSGAFISSTGGGVAQMSAILDTLKITAAGFQTKTVTITSYENQQQNITLDSAGSGATVNLDQTRQTIAGFGINNTWAPAMTDAVADALFDSVNGLGMNILRVGMASSGDQMSSNIWGDIKKAKARGVKYIIGTLWSPPATWKAGQNGGANSENGGGHLKQEYYEQWAARIAAFPAKVKQNAGVDLYAMSPQNEPDFASCGTQEPCSGDYATTLFTDAEMVALIKVVGPKLHALNPPVKVLAPEASEWLHNWSDSSACCSDPSGKPSTNPLKGDGYDYGHALFRDATAWAQLDIMGVHQYDTQIAEPWPGDVPAKKPVWQTEMCGTKWWPEFGPSAHIENGVVVAGWIHNALTVGEAEAWCWWWWKASSAGNSGLLAADGSDTKRHYTFGNYSRFVRPGMTRVDITGEIPTNVLLTAFKGANSAVVVVAINKGSVSASVPVTIAGGTAPATFTPWVTSASDNLVSKTAVAVTGGSFTATLAGKTVTTFVGK
jgi:glucuronoarabinoxylan endo-1,4-beta-xylanase